MELEELGFRLGSILAGSVKGIREAAMDVVAEADKTRVISEGSAIDGALDSLTERILSQDKASQFFKQGYELGFKDEPKVCSADSSDMHRDCFDVGYEMGRLARENGRDLLGSQPSTVAADWALGLVLKDALLLGR